MSVDRAQIEHLRGFVATPRCMSYETIRSLGDILDDLEAASAEVAALRRQLEERRVVVPELTEDDEDAARNDWAKGSPLGTIRFGYNLAVSRIRPPLPGEAVATPPPDVVTVPREEWTIAQILANAWGRHPMTCGERDKLVAEWDTLRSGEAGKGVV